MKAIQNHAKSLCWDGNHLMRNILYTVIFAIFLTVLVSHAHAFVQIRGEGIASQELQNDKPLYNASLNFELSNPSTIVNGSLILEDSQQQTVLQFIPNNWTFSYYQDGGFTGMGQIITTQDEVYTLHLDGKRVLVGNTESVWQVRGGLENNSTKYSIYCFARGPDLFPNGNQSDTAFVVIPRGVSAPSDITSFIPLHLEIFRGTTVEWINEDSVGHTVQSINQLGLIVPIFNSGFLETNQEFKFKFDNPGIYHYYDSIYPWREGTVTVW